MSIESIHTPNAPEALGPYSQGVKFGNFIFLSMQIGLDPASQELVTGGVLNQAHQVFKNLSAVLEEAGSSLDQVVKATVFLKNMGDFKGVNEIYNQYFTKPYPARAAVAVKELPKNCDIGIEVTAIG